MEHKLEQLRIEYMNIPIPAELNDRIEKALREGKKMINKKKHINRILTAAASLVVVFSAFTVGLNSNEAFAKTMSEVPVLGNIVRVLTFREYKFNKDGFDANIETPKIEGLENQELQNSLNEKYYTENKELYEQFVNDMEEIKAAGGGHLGVDSGYVIKTDTDKILSVGRYYVNTVGSSSTTFKYDTIDKENEILITLNSLFKDDSYIDIISRNIKEQMVEQAKEDENKTYWVEGVNMDMPDTFEKIREDQNFYITADNKLVISFDKYEVAPGYMGVVEFEIPTEILNDILVGPEYIK